MMAQPFYKPFYQTSHALIIGIDQYKFANPLSFAANDAKGIVGVLRAKFDFAPENITLLTDAKATRKAIMSAYMAYTAPECAGPEDRLLVFFAGHGHTASGRRGETGFLVPVDGKIEDLSTLIKWSELTGSSDLIAAKHVFFLMDACYGGLAVTRKVIPAGSMRLLQDMMQRFSRQVLTAGKADQVVTDSDGVRPGHSLFTSHVLDALEGAASATKGVITANGVMAYVYDKVGSDPLSNQTPHYGSIEGDGDFIFSPHLREGEPPADEQTLIQTPSFTEQSPLSPNESPSELLKRLIADPADKIRLDEFVTKRIRRAALEIAADKFPTQGDFSREEFLERVRRYEAAILELEEPIILLARWGSNEQLPLIQKILARLAETNDARGGLVAWIELKWYPLLLLMYAGGIAALSEQRYDVLRSILLAPVFAEERSKTRPLLFPTVDALTSIHDTFKVVPGLDRHYTPRSDHIYQTLQPVLEDNLFLGKSYDPLFDDFEILLALTYASESESNSGVWGPLGRFAWKRGYSGGGPFNAFVDEASKRGNSWPALRAGFFSGEISRFLSIAGEYSKLLGRTHWS